MKIFGAYEKVTRYAVVETDIGEFKVYANGYVEYWCDVAEAYIQYRKHDDYFDEISEMGINVLKDGA